MSNPLTFLWVHHLILKFEQSTIFTFCWVKYSNCLVLCFIFSSNMQAVMFMTCLQCSQNTWTCLLSCTCWTLFLNCLQWHTLDRLFTLPLFWSELCGGQDYPLLLLSLVRLPTQTALFIDQWPLVSDKPVALFLASCSKKSISVLHSFFC